MGERSLQAELKREMDKRIKAEARIAELERKVETVQEAHARLSVKADALAEAGDELLREVNTTGPAWITRVSDAAGKVQRALVAYREERGDE